MRTTSTRAAHARRRFPYLKRTAVVAAGVLVVAGLGMQSASAAATIVVTPAPSSTTTVGATDSITLTLTSDVADSISQVLVLPSCGGAVDGAAPLDCGNPDPGVFSLAVDTAASTCDGPSFLSIGAEDPATGIVPITPLPALAAGTDCVIVLKRTALRVPDAAHDVSGAAGAQTNWGASVFVGATEVEATAVFTTINPGPSGTGNGSCANLGAVDYGSGDDIVNGTAGDDIVDLGSGNDTFNIGVPGGNDVVCGGSGNDTITTGGGTDTVFGGSGNDVIKTGAGDDQIGGGSGNDQIDGEAGTDTLTDGGGSGNNTITNVP